MRERPVFHFVFCCFECGCTLCVGAGEEGCVWRGFGYLLLLRLLRMDL